jgi:polyisoprenoid-binding protein YceI
MKTTVAPLLPAFALLLASHAVAQRQTFAVDPQASDVSFTLGGSDHSVHGTFHVEKGEIDFDRAAPKMGGAVVVAVGSGKTGNDSRDKKMTNEVLEASKFAESTFAPESYQGTIAASGDSTIQVTGTFTLHGAPHELTVPAQIHIDGPNCVVKAKFTVPYVKWGLKDPSIFILKVAKEVEVDLTLSGRLGSAS